VIAHAKVMLSSLILRINIIRILMQMSFTLLMLQISLSLPRLVILFISLPLGKKWRF